jgi:hypothetical protein
MMQLAMIAVFWEPRLAICSQGHRGLHEELGWYAEHALAACD